MKETFEVYPGESYRTVMEIDKLREMTAQKNHRGNFELGKIVVHKVLGNVWAELIKSEISLICSKSFIKQSAFSLENSKSLFVPNKLSFENSHSSEQ